MLMKAMVPVLLLVMSDHCSQLAATNCVLQLCLFLLTSNLPALLTGTNVNLSFLVGGFGCLELVLYGIKELASQHCEPLDQ